jgi:ubiquinone biosynthesis protein UbiJ
VLTGTLEQILNRGLPRSPRARTLCAALAGKSLIIALPELARVRMSSNGVTLELTPAQPTASADATLTGGPFSLLALVTGSAAPTLQRGAAAISGDAQIAQQFEELLQLLRPDPEEELSMLVGDVAAHQIGRLARFSRAFSAHAVDTGLDNLAEYLGHERSDLVPHNEGEQFLRGVDALREGVDRAQARIELLARRRSVT